MSRPFGTRDKKAETGILNAHVFEKSKFRQKLLANSINATLISLDRGFARFPGLQWRHPGA